MRLIREQYSHRSMMPFMRLSALLTIILFTQLASAQLNPLKQADSLFATGEFEKVEMLVLRLGADQGALSDADYADLQITAGFAMIMLDREADARLYFERALDKNPDLTLDPVLISPKFRIVFDDVKIHHNDAQKEKPDKLYRGASSRSHLLNLALPGAGQIREGRLRGILYLTAQAASVALLIHELDKTADSRAYYLAQTDQAGISRAYDDYNRDYRTAWGIGFLSGAIYLFSQADLALIRSPITADNPEFSMSFLLEQPGVRLIVNW
jgi:hypothetical protein